MGRPSVYETTYPELLLQSMAGGKFDYEIYSDWNISKTTFYRWLKDYPELQEAYEIGITKCEAWWTEEMRKRFLAGDDKGFKYCISIMNNKFGWGKDEVIKSVTNQQININSINVLQDKSPQELEEILNQKLSKLSQFTAVPKLLTSDNKDE